MTTAAPDPPSSTRAAPVGPAAPVLGAGAAGPRWRSGIAPQPRGFPDRHPMYRLTQFAVAAALRCLARITVDGMERCPPSGSGPLIVASNHLSMVDIPLIGAWCPRPVLWFAKIEVYRYPVIGGIGAIYGAIYVRRGESDRQAIREALAALAAGQVLGVFPEGHRSRGQGLLRGQPGISLLAQRSGATIWPVAVRHTDQIGRRLRPHVLFRAGEPFDPVAAARDEYGPHATHQDVADLIMRRIAALLPEHERGVYR